MLTAWLDSDNEVVREWSARALADLNVTEAVPVLLAAWAASKAESTPPDWSEPVAIRRALARLQARSVVMPDELVALRVDALWGHAWPMPTLPQALEQLARARQLVLYFQCWEPYWDTWSWLETGASPELDWSLPWDTLVDVAQRQATATATSTAHPPGTVATIEWIDRSDL